ncbi:unnamed protein product [Coregonus sp. 'balchen']|nr:unnamed protein product [Coregonus sp. 'balchen']
MKEDKENTRPMEERMEIKCENIEKTEKPKPEKKEAMTKIIIRRLPPSITKEELEEQLQPLPEVDYLEFFANDSSMYPHVFARAYINFKIQEDIVLFRDRFDGYMLTTRNFLEIYNGADEKFTSTPETLLEEIEAKTKELVAKKMTPLLDFLKNKQRIREEKKEERRRRELERKRLRDEERRKWREEDRRKRKEAEKFKKGDKSSEKDKDQGKEGPKIKLLRKPDRGDDVDVEKPKEKSKNPEKDKMKDDRAPGGPDMKKRQNHETREDRAEDGHKDFRERDVDRDRDRERDKEREQRQKEKERIRRQDEDRRRRRERRDGEKSYRKREEEGRKEKGDHVWERRKGENAGNSASHTDKPKKSEETLREEKAKRDRLRNKDRPAVQLYQPGARNRGGGGGGGGESHAGERKSERDQEKGDE